MKKFLTLLCLCVSSFAWTQKVDLDPQKFDYAYRDYPTNALPAHFVTYSVSYDAPSTTRLNLPDAEVIEGVVLQGFKRLEKNAHLHVAVHLESIEISSSQVKERYEVHKDKNGKETGRTYYYWVEVQYRFGGWAQLKSYEGNTLERVNIDNGGFRSYRSTEYNSYKAASDFFNNNREELKARWAREHGRSAIAFLSNHLSNKYGFPVRQSQDQLWILDNKSHPEYEAHNKALKSVQTAMKTMSADAHVGAIKEQLKPVLEYFESLKTKYNKDEKRDRKMRYASFYNLGKIYLYLDELDAAIKEGEGLVKNEYDEKDGKRIIEEAQRVKEVFNKNKANTRHFPIELDKMEGPK